MRLHRPRTAPAAGTQAAPTLAYHGLTAAQSAQKVRQLEAKGYRPITVNVPPCASSGQDPDVS
ncbi:hypothetical protein ACTMTI_01730 [Nonomuraea sp. H19]|uniref:hypothetical protein n=1 Tax=Nonomuraea sp. H19 TaxID=3452206 RepID=UPI003F894D5D